MQIYLEWSSDFIINPSGGLQKAVGWDEVRQSIMRFLLTNRSVVQASGYVVYGDVVFHPEYGLGSLSELGELIDEQSFNTLRDLCIQAVLSNPNVSKVPSPQVRFATEQHTIYAFITVSPLNLPPGVIAIAFQPQPGA